MHARKHIYKDSCLRYRQCGNIDVMQLLCGPLKQCYISFKRFLEFLWLHLYKHATKGTGIREVGAEHSKHKSPIIPWMCYFGISPHFSEII